MKTIRETMREKGVLKDFLKSHKYDPGQKYRFGNLGDFSVLDEPMSYMDVSATIARSPWTLLPRKRAPCLQAWASLPLPSLLWVTVQRIGKCPSDLSCTHKRALWQPRGSLEWAPVGLGRYRGQSWLLLLMWACGQQLEPFLLASGQAEPLEPSELSHLPSDSLPGCLLW